MLSAFTAGLLLVGVSELGDKTFFIAVILAMRHSRSLIFVGVLAALAVMTVLSVLMGEAVSVLPSVYIHYAGIALFAGFGVKLLYEASQMPAASCGAEVVLEATEVVEKAEFKSLGQTPIEICLEAFVLTFLAEWGDRTQFATIALAAHNNPVGVTIGAILGHTICTAIAVIGGRMLAGQISERTLTGVGGCLFLVFGIVAWLQG